MPAQLGTGWWLPCSEGRNAAPCTRAMGALGVAAPCSRHTTSRRVTSSCMRRSGPCMVGLALALALLMDPGWSAGLKPVGRKAALPVTSASGVSTDPTTLVAPAHRRQAAVFTPYHITPGGGEKYLLSTVQAMQAMNMAVDILVQPDNICQTSSCVLDVANALRVRLDPDAFTVHVVHKEGYRVYAGPYDVFFALGNEKYPPVAAIGQVNIFMCQFPFDLERPIDASIALGVLATYNVVILNSHYSLRWYHTFSQPMFEAMRSADSLFPRMQILHPPVTLLQPAAADGDASVAAGVASPKRRNIVMVGRFFSGRQSKGHPQAIRIFADLVPLVPADTKLIMVGNVMPGQTYYLDELRASIKQLGLESRIVMEVSAPAARVQEVLQSGLVQWHLTGLGVHNDPASLEHFGISIVEGMSTGAVPVAYIGGAEDIIQAGQDGWVARSAEEVKEYTRRIFNMSMVEQREMQARVQEKAHQFEYRLFEKRFHNLVRATSMIRPVQPINKSVLSAWRK